MKRIDLDIDIKSREPRTLAAVNAELGKLKKAEKAAIQQKVYDFSKKFGKLTATQASNLAKELGELDIARMTEEHVIEIINIIPRTDAELKMIFAASKTMLKPEDLENITSVIKKYTK